jgi:hypothetical protein
MNISQGEGGGNGVHLGVVNQWFLSGAARAVRGYPPKGETGPAAIEHGMSATGISPAIITVVNDLVRTLGAG